MGGEAGQAAVGAVADHRPQARQLGQLAAQQLSSDDHVVGSASARRP